MKIAIIFLSIIAIAIYSSKGDQYYRPYQESYFFEIPPIIKNESVWELNRIGEEIQNLVEVSVNKSRLPCNSFFEYVCAENSLISSVLGSMPRVKDLVIMFNALRNDDTVFYGGAKNKLINFYKSCSKRKSVDDCHIESFEYFKPLYGFIIARKFVTDDNKETLRDVLLKFINRARSDGFLRSNENLVYLDRIYTELIDPNTNFQTYRIDETFMNLTIYPESYAHNIRNLERFTAYNWYSSSYASNLRNSLDFTIYLYQSRNKPRSFYYATLNVHLWMVLYSNTIMFHDGKKYKFTADCYKLPSFVDMLDIARNFTVIYHKSLISALEDYAIWQEHGSGPFHIQSREVYNKENEILETYNLSNEHLFFIYFTQNFCGFGRLVAENVFLQGLRHNVKFISLYNCGVGTLMNPDVKCDLP